MESNSYYRQANGIVFTKKLLYFFWTGKLLFLNFLSLKIFHRKVITFLTLPPSISERLTEIKIILKFYFRTSLWGL